ncbi:MAG TPA: glycosyltransferase family 25 protein [Dongiaceae bacterium]|nr:glycosyltransferase family 25 protein [Dongiaceae bacterium]
MPINAWIISLNPGAETAQNLKNTLQDAGIDAQMFPAVDGRREMPALDAGERVSQTKALIYRKARLTTSEVGCYLSHLRLIKQAYAQHHSHVCIFEDDVVAEPGLGDLIKDVVQLGEDFHLVRLMTLKIRKRKLLQKLPSGYTLTRPERGALGCQGYVLNRTGMKKIIDASAAIYMPIDKVVDSFFLYDLHCFSVEPHAIYEQMHNSSIIKTAGKLDKRPWVTILWHLNKLYRSIRRRLHYIKHYSAYYPTVKPEGKLGKSQRIR